MTFCQRPGDNALQLTSLATVDESICEFPPLNDYSSRYGRGAGVGRGLGVGVPLGVAVGVAVGVGVGVPPPTKLNLPMRVCQSPF